MEYATSWYDAKKATASGLRKVFPDDLHMAADAMIAEGDKVKDSGKTVANVGFLTRSGMLLPGGAYRLNVAVDWVSKYRRRTLGGT